MQRPDGEVIMSIALIPYMSTPEESSLVEYVGNSDRLPLDMYIILYIIMSWIKI